MNARFIVGILFIIVGISAFTGLSPFQFVFGIILVYIGIRLLSRHSHGGCMGTATPSSADSLNEVAVFSPLNRAIVSQAFKGGKAVLIFSGGTLDLSGAKASGSEIPLEIVAVFGGAKLIVPNGWNVVPRGTAIFGGYNNKVAVGGDTTLTLTGSVLFGGIEIETH